MRASPLILFGDNALAIKADATFALTVGALQPFSNLNDLYGEVPQSKWITFESNMWKLDGSYHFMPAVPHVGLMTTDMSDADGVIWSVPILSITFDAVHSTNGLTLRFSEATNDYCNAITVQFYNASNVLIQDNSYTPTNPVFSTNQAVSNFKKIVIAFSETNKPYRFARLMGIDFDTATRFTGAEIREARLVEQINPLSIELLYNEVSATLFSSNGDFSIVNPAGVFATFHENQPLEVYENINNDILYIGRFYLSEWNSKSANLADIRAVDAIGFMDTIDYLPEGDNAAGVDPIEYYSGGSSHQVLSEDLIADIMAQAGIDYSLDVSLEGIVMSPASLYGKSWLGKVSSCRECLQLVLFVIGAYATVARSNVVNIIPLAYAADLVAYDHTFTTDELSQNSDIKLRPLVTGAEITSHDYSYDSTSTSLPWVELGALPVGVHIVTFNEPISPPFTTNFSPPGSVTISNYGSAWMELTVSAPTTFVRVSAFRWTDTTMVTGVYSVSPAGANNIVKVDATTVSKANAATVAQRVYDYFQQRYKLTTKVFTQDVAVGDSVLAAAQGAQIAGFIEKVTTDLAGNFISQIEIVGVVVP